MVSNSKNHSMHTKVMARIKKYTRTDRHRTAIVSTMSSSPQAGSTNKRELLWLCWN